MMRLMNMMVQLRDNIRNCSPANILAEGAIALSVTLSGGALFAS